MRPTARITAPNPRPTISRAATSSGSCSRDDSLTVVFVTLPLRAVSLGDGEGPQSSSVIEWLLLSLIGIAWLISSAWIIFA